VKDFRKPSKRALRFRFRNRALRAVVWIFLAVFVVSVLGIAIVTSTTSR